MPKSRLTLGKKYMQKKGHGGPKASHRNQQDSSNARTSALKDKEIENVISKLTEVEKSMTVSGDAKATGKPTSGTHGSEKSVFNIERLHDDIRIACERLEEQGHESFLVTVSRAGHMTMGSAKGRQFIEEKMGLIEDFICFCMDAISVVKIETEDTNTDMISADLKAAYEDDTDDNEDIPNVTDTSLDAVKDELDVNQIKAEKRDEKEFKIRPSSKRKSHKRKQKPFKNLPKNVKEVTVVLNQLKEVQVLSAKSAKKEETKDKSTKKPVSLLSVKRFSCELCGHRFLYQTHLEEHKLRNPNCKDRPQLTDAEKTEIILQSSVSVQDKNTGEMKTKTIREMLDKSEAPFECEVCSKSFDGLSRLKRHIFPHAEPKPFECLICCETFNNRESLRKHMILHNVRPYYCMTCRHRYQTAKSAESHQRLCAGNILRCPACDYRASSLTDLSQHKKTHRAVTCEICGKSLANIRIMMRHKQTVHSTDYSHQCKICNNVFKAAVTLRRHMVTHGEKKKKCEMCDYMCFSQTSLNHHMRTHTGEKPFICDVCGKQYRNKCLMENHRRLHTGERPYVCDFEGCDKTFRSPLTLKQHKCSHATSCAHICDFCGRSFKVKGQLRHHRKNHVIEFRWPCQYCEDKFKSCDRFKTHIAKSHPDKIKEVEEGSNIKFYPCTRCSRILINIEDLREHMNIHTGDKPHKCRHCGKGFSSRKNMRQHEKSHTGEQKLRCCLCPKKYSDPVAMQAHMKRLHNQNIDTDDVAKMEEMIYANSNTNTGKKTKKYDADTDNREEAIGMPVKKSKRVLISDDQQSPVDRPLPPASQTSGDKYEKTEFETMPSLSPDSSNEDLMRVEVQSSTSPMFGTSQEFQATPYIPPAHSLAQNIGPRGIAFPLLSQMPQDGLHRNSMSGHPWT